MTRETLVLDGREYVYEEGRWTDSRTRLRPPTEVIAKLNAMIGPALDRQDATIADVNELLKRSRAARDMMQERRAERLARRALQLEPTNVGAAAVLCAALRALRDPKGALAATAAFRGTSYAPLLTSRAGALCDLGEWELALKEAKHAYAAQGGRRGTSGPGDVMNRIKGARPDLFPDDGS